MSKKRALLVALASPFAGVQVFAVSFFASYVPGPLLACVFGTTCIGLLVAGLMVVAERASRE